MLSKVTQQELEQLKSLMESAGKEFITDYSELDVIRLSGDSLEDIDNAPDVTSKLYVINKMIYEHRAIVRVTKDGKQIFSES
jgi:hypothetical protein